MGGGEWAWPRGRSLTGRVHGGGRGEAGPAWISTPTSSTARACPRWRRGTATSTSSSSGRTPRASTAAWSTRCGHAPLLLIGHLPTGHAHPLQSPFVCLAAIQYGHAPSFDRVGLATPLHRGHAPPVGMATPPSTWLTHLGHASSCIASPPSWPHPLEATPPFNMADPPWPRLLLYRLAPIVATPPLSHAPLQHG